MELDASTLPFSGASERNKAPILTVLRDYLGAASRVLEIGGGTGQHAEYFASELAHLVWQSSDTGTYLPGLRARLEQAGLANTPAPLEIDVRDRPWPVTGVDAVFSANTLHIMSWQCVIEFFAGIGEVLQAGGHLLVYGPFRYRGDFTTPSNAAFDQSLRRYDPLSGIRDFERVDELAAGQGLEFVEDRPMPANNQMLVWVRGHGLMSPRKLPG